MTRGYAVWDLGLLCLASSSRGGISMTVPLRFVSG